MSVGQSQLNYSILNTYSSATGIEQADQCYSDWPASKNFVHQPVQTDCDEARLGRLGTISGQHCPEPLARKKWATVGKGIWHRIHVGGT